MTSEQALALVVRGTDWSESSRIVTLFTREHGRIRALAKGGRRLKSNFEIALDLLNLCRIVYLKKASNGLDVLTEARVEERFPILRRSLMALYAGYYVAELLADGTHDYDPHPGLFDAAVASLRMLSDGVESRPGEFLSILVGFELVWLRELGYSPRLESCAGCGIVLVGQAGSVPRLGYSASLGGVVCSSCLSLARESRVLSPDCWQVLRHLSEQQPGPTEPVPGPVQLELRSLVSQTVSTVLGRRPRMLGYLDVAFRGGG